VLEHDALLLHKLDMDIPEKHLVALGYKVEDPANYDHVKAGPTTRFEKRSNHGGAHAYAITHNTAQMMLDDLQKNGLQKMIDNSYFLRLGSKNKNQTTLCIADPICAIGWIRESTIWKKAAVDNYRPVLPSFDRYYNSKKNMGLKK